MVGDGYWRIGHSCGFLGLTDDPRSQRLYHGTRAELKLLYHVLGAGFCAIAIAVMVFVDPTARTGAMLSWTALPTFGCSLLAVAVGLLGLRESRSLAQSVG